MKTFIRRLGNKSGHLKKIIPFVPSFTGRYIEPFLGTGAMLLHLLPDSFIINDLNNDISAIWSLVKNNPEYIIKEISLFKEKFLELNAAEKLAYCKKIVAKLRGYKGDKQTVMYLLMVYCSYMGNITKGDKDYFDSLYSHILLGQSFHIFTERYTKKLRFLKDYLQKGSIYCLDYNIILKKARKGDFVFLDPPYIEEKKYSFQYIKKEGEFDIYKLLVAVKRLDSIGVKWMMTQIDNDLVRRVFKGYFFVGYSAGACFRSINNRKEVMIMNYKI